MVRMVTVAALCCLISAPLQAEDRQDFLYTYLGFGSYQAQVIEVETLPKLKLEKDTIFWQYRSTIRGAYEDAVPTFAGHYTIAHWGCGTECQSGAVIDLLSGELYQLPTTRLGQAYYPESNLFVSNTEVDEDTPEHIKQGFYLWDGHSFTLLREERALVVDGGE